jgi:hypothetical protein
VELMAAATSSSLLGDPGTWYGEPLAQQHDPRSKIDVLAFKFQHKSAFWTSSLGSFSLGL